MATPNPGLLEEQIDQWRGYLRRRQAIHSVDVAELEDHLREQVAGLVEAGLASDEAFLVAVKRMGALDALSREFAREHSERLWKQLVVVPEESGESQARVRMDAMVAFALAVLAALSVKLPALFGIGMEDHHEAFYLHNVPLFILPFLAGYFAWKRRLDASMLRSLAVVFIGAAVFANIYPWVQDADPQKRGRLFGSTEALRRCTCPWPSGSRWAWPTRAPAGGRWPAAWTSFDSRANSSSTTC